MGSTIQYRNCRCCGNRYPCSDGYGWFNEFCSNGYQIRYDQMDPGYSGSAKKRYKRKKLFKWIIRIVIIIVVILIAKALI